MLKRETSPIWWRQKNAKDVSDVDVQSNKTQQKALQVCYKVQQRTWWETMEIRITAT